MNAKKAKLLRKLLKRMAASTDKLTGKHSFLENEGKRKTIQVEDISEETGGAQLVTKTITVSRGQMVVNPTTERGLYLHLKRSS